MTFITIVTAISFAVGFFFGAIFANLEKPRADRWTTLALALAYALVSSISTWIILRAFGA